MGVLKYKNSQGNWEEVIDISQIITIEVDKPVVNGVWKEIEVTADSSGDFDCSGAGINLLESENWIFCGSGIGVNDTNNSSFHAVAANKPQAVFISPFIARLKGEDMSSDFKRIGIYTLNVDAYGYKGFGSDLFVHKNYAVAMEQGTNTASQFRVYSNSIYTDNSWSTTGKLIYLDNEED